MVTLRIQYYQASAATRARLPQLAEARALAESEHVGELIEQVELLIRIVLLAACPAKGVLRALRLRGPARVLSAAPFLLGLASVQKPSFSSASMSTPLSASHTREPRGVAAVDDAPGPADEPVGCSASTGTGVESPPSSKETIERLRWRR